jgi:hypothetical protein
MEMIFTSNVKIAAASRPSGSAFRKRSVQMSLFQPQGGVEWILWRQAANPEFSVKIVKHEYVSSATVHLKALKHWLRRFCFSSVSDVNERPKRWSCNHDSRRFLKISVPSRHRPSAQCPIAEWHFKTNRMFPYHFSTFRPKISYKLSVPLTTLFKQNRKWTTLTFKQVIVLIRRQTCLDELKTKKSGLLRQSPLIIMVSRGRRSRVSHNFLNRHSHHSSSTFHTQTHFPWRSGSNSQIKMQCCNIMSCGFKSFHDKHNRCK